MNTLRTVSILRKTLPQAGEKRCTQALASTAEMVLGHFSAGFLMVFLGHLTPFLNHTFMKKLANTWELNGDRNTPKASPFASQDAQALHCCIN